MRRALIRMLPAAVLALSMLGAGCTPRVPPGGGEVAIDAVACGTSDAPGSVPRGHTVYADGRVVRWTGRSGASGGVEVGTSPPEAVEALWRAARTLEPTARVTASGPLAFVEITRGEASRRFSRALDPSPPDTTFDAALAACRATLAAVE